MKINILNETLRFENPGDKAVLGGETLNLTSSGLAKFAVANAQLYITTEGRAYAYKPADWRAEIYLQGLVKRKNQQRPDNYEEEILDLFDSIYDMRQKKFKTNQVGNPNDLNYFIDYLEPVDDTGDYSINSIGQKIYSMQEDNIIKLYDAEVPNLILLDIDADSRDRESDIKRCELEGQPYANLDNSIYSNLAIGTSGYSAQETARQLLYQYTNYNDIVNIQTVPIYHLDVNSRITINDSKTGINGDYIIKTISIPLEGKSPMTISASKAIDRV